MKKNKKVDEKFISKEIKRNRNINDDTTKTISFIIIFLIVALFIMLLYFLNGNFVTKDLVDETETTEEIKFDNTKIHIDDVFNKGNSYYVLFYDTSDDKESILYDSLIANYSDQKKPIYVVDLSLKMNRDCYDVDGKENKKPKTSSDIIITKPTLIEFNKKEVIKYITEKTEITKLLNKNK